MTSEGYMGSRPNPAKSNYAISPVEDRRGLSCGADGPRLGPISFLIKTAAGFVPRSTEELDFVLTHTLGRPTSSASLARRLQVIACALDQADLGRAMIATQQMRLAPLTEAQARRATEAEAIAKAGFNPNQPRWPAGTPEARGGKFSGEEVAQEDAMNGANASEMIQRRLTRIAMRRAYKEGLRVALNPVRLFRYGLEGLSNLVPVLDAFGDGAAMVDSAEEISEFADLHRDAEVARAFVAHGPYDLEELKMPGPPLRFSSFRDFTKLDLDKHFGPAGNGYVYHHLVEQGSNDLGFSAQQIQSTENIVRIPDLIHDDVTAASMKKIVQDGARVSPRDALRTASFEDRYRAGVAALRELGVIK